MSKIELMRQQLAKVETPKTPITDRPVECSFCSKPAVQTGTIAFGSEKSRGHKVVPVRWCADDLKEWQLAAEQIVSASSK